MWCHWREIHPFAATLGGGGGEPETPCVAYLALRLGADSLFFCVRIRITVLNKGDPPIDYQLYWITMGHFEDKLLAKWSHQCKTWLEQNLFYHAAPCAWLFSLHSCSGKSLLPKTHATRRAGETIEVRFFEWTNQSWLNRRCISVIFYIHSCVPVGYRWHRIKIKRNWHTCHSSNFTEILTCMHGSDHNGELSMVCCIVVFTSRDQPRCEYTSYRSYWCDIPYRNHQNVWV